MRLTEPNQAYPQIWKALTGEKVAVEQARNLLEKKFSSEDKSQIVMRSTGRYQKKRDYVGKIPKLGGWV